MLPSLHHEGFYVAYALNLSDSILDFLECVLFVFWDKYVSDQGFQAVGDGFFLESEYFGVLGDDGLDLLF